MRNEISSTTLNQVTFARGSELDKSSLNLFFSLLNTIPIRFRANFTVNTTKAMPLHFAFLFHWVVLHS